MKKSLLIIGAIALSAAAARADESMIIDFSDAAAEDVKVALAGIERVTFSDGKVNIQGTDEKTTSYALADIERIQFSAYILGVDDITAEAVEGVSLVHTPGTDVMSLCGITDNADVMVYDLAGRLMLATVNNGDINIAGLTNGKTYIVTADGFSAKFIK